MYVGNERNWNKIGGGGTKETSIYLLCTTSDFHGIESVSIHELDRRFAERTPISYKKEKHPPIGNDKEKSYFRLHCITTTISFLLHPSAIAAKHYYPTHRPLVSYKLYLFGQLAGLVWWVDDLVIKNGEVESKTEPDGMRRLHFWLCYVKRFLVRFLWILDYRCNANREIHVTISTNVYIKRDHPLPRRIIYVKDFSRREEWDGGQGKNTSNQFRVISMRSVYRISLWCTWTYCNGRAEHKKKKSLAELIGTR